MFKITRVYTDTQGESQFEDQELSLENAGEIGSLSELIPARGLIFREVLPTYDFGFHNAPLRVITFYQKPFKRTIAHLICILCAI